MKNIVSHGGMKIPGKRALKLVREKESDEFAMRDKRARSEEARTRCTGKLRGPSRMYASDASQPEILIGFVRSYGMRTTGRLTRNCFRTYMYTHFIIACIVHSLFLSWMLAWDSYVPRKDLIKNVDASIKRRLYLLMYSHISRGVLQSYVTD